MHRCSTGMIVFQSFPDQEQILVHIVPLEVKSGSYKNA